MGKKTLESENGQLDELRQLVADGVGGVAQKETNRRGMLRLAGAAVLGAAGAAALKAVPASAASGNFMVVGCANTSSSQTTLTADAGDAGANLYLIGNANQYGLIAGGNSGSNEIGVWGASKSGSGTGVSGTATTGVGTKGTATTGVGVEGIASSGTAVYGAATTGYGVSGSGGSAGVYGSSAAQAIWGAGTTGRGGLFTSTTGYDVALGYPVIGGVVGSGRLGMVGRLDTGAVAPNIAPAFAVTSTGSYTFEHELVRGNDSSIWASRFMASGTNQSRWKRINAVRVDSADGTGAPYAPYRVYDSRVPAGSPRKAVNSVTAVQIAGQGTGASAIPADAIAIMGNLTATAYTGGGYLALSPNGVTVTTSSVNFITGQSAIANGFIVGLAGGKVQVKVAGHASHFVIDVTGYMQ